jgi:hypothetical protein
LNKVWSRPTIVRARKCAVHTSVRSSPLPLPLSASSGGMGGVRMRMKPSSGQEMEVEAEVDRSYSSFPAAS